MPNDSRRPGAILTAALFSVLTLANSARAQSPQYGPDSSDIRQTVARVSYLSGPVSYARGDAPDEWQPPDLNVPLTLGDRVYTGRGGRMELQIHGGTSVRLDADTDLAALNLTEDTKQFSQTVGVAAFQVRRLDAEEIVEVDTPNAAITFDAPGDYRIDVDGDGNTRVSVRKGRVLVASGGGQVTLQSGDEMDIQGIDRPQYDVYGITAADAFDRWVAGRESRSSGSRSREYVSDEIVGVADLDDSGRWEDIPEYGRAWCPNAVAADWAPYRVGHWVWQDPWGWTWISAESWGWAPYHYGRWVTHSSRWYWVPVGRAVRSVYYSPALVAFVGGGPGFSANVGWFPLAPRDPFIPWWGARRAIARPASVAYVNRSYVTVVNQNTFVSGGLVSRGWVRDQTVVRQAVAAPVLRGPLPFVPTQAALRVAVRTNLPAASRPPAIVLSRPVVARVAPPPRPPAFSAKLDVIRQNRGAPVDAGTAARMVEQRGRPEPVAVIRPAASGQVTLAPGARREGRSAPASAPSAVQPIAPVRGRPLATVERPVLAPAPAPAPAAAPAAGSAPAPSGNSRGNPRGESSRNRQQPPAQAQPQPQAVQPVPAAPASGEQPAQDHRRRAIDRQPAVAPTAVAPATAAQPRGRPAAPVPAPAAGGTAPQNGPPPQELRRQTNRGRRSLEQTPPPQHTAAPAQPAAQSERGRRAVPPPQAQPQAPQPQPAKAQPAPAQPAPQAEKQNQRPAPEARGRGNAQKPPPPTKDEKKDEKKKEEKKPD